MLSNIHLSDTVNPSKSNQSSTNSKLIETEIRKVGSNIQDWLKSLAMISMIIDHIGLFIFPNIEIFRVIGRLAMPIFCFFAGYNFKGKRRSIVIKLGFILSIIQYLCTQSVPTLNILFTIYFGQLYLQKCFTLTNDLISNIFQLLPLILFTPATFLFFDYGTLGICIIALGYLYKNSLSRRTYIFLTCALTALYSQIIFGFDLHNFILLVSLCIILYFLLVAFGNYENKTDNKIYYMISRNSLLIYFVHVAILQTLVTLF